MVIAPSALNNRRARAIRTKGATSGETLRRTPLPENPGLIHLIIIDNHCPIQSTISGYKYRYPGERGKKNIKSPWLVHGRFRANPKKTPERLEWLPSIRWGVWPSEGFREPWQANWGESEAHSIASSLTVYTGIYVIYILEYKRTWFDGINVNQSHSNDPTPAVAVPHFLAEVRGVTIWLCPQNPLV